MRGKVSALRRQAEMESLKMLTCRRAVAPSATGVRVIRLEMCALEKKSRDQRNLTPPELLSTGARFLAAASVLTGIALVSLLAVSSSQEAIDHKLTEFNAAGVTGQATGLEGRKIRNSASRHPSGSSAGC